MSKAAGWIISRWAGVSLSAALAGMGIVALRHALETPQPLKSVLPGEAHLYRWQRRSIFYKVLGSTDAPPLVLLHRPEIGASGHEMLPLMSPLAESYRVYAPDWLGFGLSDRPGTEYSADLYSALCRDFLRDVVQQPATLVASGLSCNYAVATAATAPNLCSSLVLISPHTLLAEKPAVPLKQLAEKPLVKALLYPLLSTQLAFRLMHGFQRQSKEDFIRFYANTHQLGAEHAAMALLAGKLAGNMEQQFTMLQQPVLSIWGTYALDKQQTVDNLHKATTLLANPAHRARKVEIIQEATLAVHLDQPEGVITAIRHWQEEMNQDEISAQKETLLFTLQTADRQKARTSKPADLSTQVPTPPPVEEERMKPALPVSSERRELEVTAYCVKCKQKRTMLNAREVTMKNGRPATRGICPVCGTRLNRIGGIS